MAHSPAMDTAGRASTVDRRASLRRMRIVATGLLLLMLVAFAVCWRFEAIYPWLAYPRAFAEAGMVGACADWFAVVALFRHPLGLPIPHTAILPRNKKRIGDTLGAFFARNFINSAEIEARLDKVDVAGFLAGWLRSPENAQLLAQWSRGLLPTAIDLVGSSRLRHVGGDLVKKGIDSIAAAPLAARVLAVLVAHGQHEQAYDFALAAAIDFLDENRETIRRKAAERSAGWLPSWVDARAADAFVEGLRETLIAGCTGDHPWRDEFRAFLDGWIGRLADDPELYERCERIKSEVLDTKIVDDYLAWLTAESEAALTTEFDDAMLAETLQRIMGSIADWLDAAESARNGINRSARQLVTNAVVPRRGDIGTYVSDVVGRWDSETLVERLELQVGRDLQFIRINGTLVGGAVGLVLFTIVRLIG